MSRPSILKFIFVVLCIVAIVLALAGCGSSTRGSLPAPKPPTPADDLVSLGRALIWIGGAAAAIGIALRFFVGASSVLGEAILAAIAVCGFGIACSWLGQHPYVIWGLVVAILVAVTYRYRRGIRRLYERTVVDSATNKT